MFFAIDHEEHTIWRVIVNLEKVEVNFETMMLWEVIKLSFHLKKLVHDLVCTKDSLVFTSGDSVLW